MISSHANIITSYHINISFIQTFSNCISFHSYVTNQIWVSRSIYIFITKLIAMHNQAQAFHSDLILIKSFGNRKRLENKFIRFAIINKHDEYRLYPHYRKLWIAINQLYSSSSSWSTSRITRSLSSSTLSCSYWSMHMTCSTMRTYTILPDISGA